MRRDKASPFEVLAAFVRLGLTCFGGPVAHLGYFHAAFVTRRCWISEQAFAELVALCQFLPGPASSQTGFAIGLARAGLLGGLAAWIGFTLPSAVLMVAFALGAAPLAGSSAFAGALHGLRLIAVAVVAQAAWSMARRWCPDRARAAIAVVSLVIALIWSGSSGQVATLCAGGLAGVVFCRAEVSGSPPDLMVIAVPRRLAWTSLACFAALLISALLLPPGRDAGGVFIAFYRSGALVFGGGHVVLPLLRDAVVGRGWIGSGAFLAGYGAAQAVPGPLFTFAAYLGALMGGIGFAAIALLAIFLPGLLLLVGVMPFRQALRGNAWSNAALRGINAAVVGLLGATLHDLSSSTSFRHPADILLALTGLVLLTVWRVPPLYAVVLGAAVGCEVWG